MSATQIGSAFRSRLVAGTAERLAETPVGGGQMVSDLCDKSKKHGRYVPSPTGLLRESTTCVEKQLVSDSTSK